MIYKQGWLLQSSHGGLGNLFTLRPRHGLCKILPLAACIATVLQAAISTHIPPHAHLCEPQNHPL